MSKREKIMINIATIKRLWMRNFNPFFAKWKVGGGEVASDRIKREQGPRIRGVG